MSGLPDEVAARVAAVAGRPLRRVTEVGGGCINRGARVACDGREVFVKWRQGSPAGFFEAEADGLRRLAATGTVRVPEVLRVDDDGAVGSLVLGWIEPGSDRGAAQADAGRRLALLHAERGLAPGLERDNFIGSLCQDNAGGVRGAWLPFFRARRLLALSEGLPPGTRRRLESLPLERWLDEPTGGCALLHGDLWGGNLICGARAQGWVIDPAVYAGHPEVDLAMTRLFGGFGAHFYDAYQEVAGRFDRELDARLELLNLYPLLVHTRLFGGGYLAQVEGILGRYGRRG